MCLRRTLAENNNAHAGKQQRRPPRWKTVRVAAAARFIVLHKKSSDAGFFGNVYNSSQTRDNLLF
jgi:hypothetical protein